MASGEASPSLERMGESDKEETADMEEVPAEPAAAGQGQAAVTTAREEPREGQCSNGEWRHLRQVRGRHRAALT